MKANRCLTITLVVALIGAACSGDGGVDETGMGVVVPASTAPTANPDGSAEPADDRHATEDSEGVDATALDFPAARGARQLSPLADQVRSVGDIRFDPTVEIPNPAPRPVGLSIEGIDVEDAPIRDVGVEPNGEMEIPGATEVGWYRWSPSPGRRGSSVLAAHIAFNGRDGVFRNLDELAVGDRFTVRYDDGSERDFEINATSQYAKTELPVEQDFDKDGSPSVVLITSGGDYNRSENSYEDNVVVYAEPI